MDQIIGTVENPLAGTGYEGLSGVGTFISNVLRLFFVVAGVLALFNFIVAGYSYMNAAGDSKKLDAAWSKIWLSLVGLIIIVASFAISALFGQLIFGNPLYFLRPSVYGPGQ
ncbi:MAG TPA: hypothetical protein VJB96_02745 [Patescibacteria group bacterium]|nr:hypothetical protein [Patescibacteria group bacterium]